MHPAKNVVVHVDLQRVVPTEKLRIRLPIHFKGEAVSPGVKLQGGIVSHRLSDVEVLCLPQDLPEFLEMDLSGMNLNETKFLSDLPVPNGVTLTALSGGRNPPVASVHAPRAEEPEPTAEAAAAAPAEGAAAAAPAAGAAPAAAGADAAKKDEKAAAAAPAKKEGGKK
jgi:large subunit ribosomal protein L25